MTFNQEKNVFAPTVLWLQGPPGETSLFGLFLENGPYVPIHENIVQGREEDWTKKFNMIYIDAPVGTGFSFTEDENCYAKNQRMVRDDLFEGLQQLYTIFPEIQPYDLFIVGESYGGKYGPAIAHKIHEEKGVAKMKLKGMAIGDGWSDPETQAYYSDFLFQISLIDVEEAKFMKAEQDRYIQMIKKGDFVGALGVFAPLVDGEGSWLRNVTGFSWFNNFLKASPPSSAEGHEWDFKSFFKSNESRNAIHVGSRVLSEGKIVAQHLEGDIMDSVKPWVATIMENYRVLIYNGQLDIIVAPSLTENYIRSINWSGAEEYVKAPKAVWKLDPNDVEPAGYLKKVGNFHRAILRNGGHNFILDQPRVALQLIDSFIHERC